MHGRLERKGGKESMLRIEHFSKRYKGGKKAVDDLNLFVQEIFMDSSDITEPGKVPRSNRWQVCWSLRRERSRLTG